MHPDTLTNGTERPKPSRKDLAHRRKLFVEFYLGQARGNGTEAARLAGYEFPAEEAYRLLKNAHVRARIDERLAAHAMTAEQVLAELSEIALAPWRDFVMLKVDDAGNLVPVKFDLSSKVKSLELLGKYHQLFVERVDVSGDLGVRYELVGVDLEELP